MPQYFSFNPTQRNPTHHMCWKMRPNPTQPVDGPNPCPSLYSPYLLTSLSEVPTAVRVFFDPCSLVTQYKSSGITSKFSGPFCLHAPSVENSSHTRNLKNHGRPHIGANGASWPPWKNGWKIKKRNMQNKSSFLNIWEQSGQAGVENSAVLTT